MLKHGNKDKRRPTLRECVHVEKYKGTYLNFQSCKINLLLCINCLIELKDGRQSWKVQSMVFHFYYSKTLNVGFDPMFWEF